MGGVGVAYVGLWLALALLCSVCSGERRRPRSSPSRSGLSSRIFASLSVGLFAGIFAPLGDGNCGGAGCANPVMQQNLAALSPGRLFTEATQALLDPSVRTLDVIGRVQVGTDNRALPSLLSLDQSLLVAWPQFVTLIALTAGMFALAYVSFMRQEVRA